MNFAPFRLAGWLFGNTLLLCSAVSGEGSARRRETGARGDVPAPMPGVFATELPQLVLPESLRLSVRPHFGDFVRHDHFRVTLGARYGLTPQWELSGDADVYFSHGLGDVEAGQKVGVSRIQFGVKYHFEDFLRPYWDSAAGFTYRFPVGHPPADITDGLHHFTPYLTHAHVWARRPEVTTFVSYGVDFVSGEDVVGTIEDGGIDADHWFVRPGVVWSRGDFVYSLETIVTSTWGLDSSGDYRVTLRPGVKWTLPPKFTFHSRSRWTVGLSVSASHGSAGPDLGVNVRLQTNFNFRHFFKSRYRDVVGRGS